MSLTPAATDLKQRFGVKAHPDYEPRCNIASRDDLDVHGPARLGMKLATPPSFGR